jgi:hypothetical protein
MNSEIMNSPVYANVVGIRTTPAELILQFGCAFGAPSQPIVGPENITPSVSLVLPIGSLPSLVELLTKAADEHNKAMRDLNAAPSLVVSETKIPNTGS